MHERPTNRYLNQLNIPTDALYEIVKYIDLIDFIHLCNSSKEINNLCTYDIWKAKFKQSGYPFEYKHQLFIYNDLDKAGWKFSDLLL
jgi:F-box associated protein